MRASIDPAHPRPIQLTGRASYVWLYGVLVPIAIGHAPDGVKIRRCSPEGPWHLVTATPDEAYEELLAGYRMLPALKRMVTRRRRRL